MPNPVGRASPARTTGLIPRWSDPVKPSLFPLTPQMRMMKETYRGDPGWLSRERENVPK